MVHDCGPTLSKQSFTRVCADQDPSAIASSRRRIAKCRKIFSDL